ncbi:MAG: hypothetical protein J6P83_10380 [Bacteroidales bacterium]|nr:hypothetical protein [Bacteroidales bacterium]
MKVIAAVMLMTAVFFSAGCNKPDDPNNGGNGGNINPNYVVIDWTEATLLSSNDSIGDYQIQFNGEMPELKPGSVITIDQDTVVHHRFVKSLTVEGNTVRMTSTEAYLTDIFAETDFTLSTAENGKSSGKGRTFYPTEIYQIAEDGAFQGMNMKAARDGGFGFTHNLWHFGQNFDGEVISSGSNYSIYMEKLNFDFDVDLEMYMNFSGRDVVEILDNGLERYRSNALNVNAYLLGSFDTEQKVRCDIQGSCSWNPGYDLWKHNLFRPLYVRFLVYGVPVVIKINSDLYRQVQVTASGEISAYTGFTDNAEGRLGFEWHQSSDMTPVATFSNTFEYTPPTVEGRGTVQAKVWAFPRIRLLLYGLVGPSFDIKPYFSTTLSGGFKEEMLGAANDFCAWSLDCNTGLDASCGLSLQFMGYEVENYSTPNWNVFDKVLYHSPKKVLHASKDDGQRRTVSFDVYDHNYLLGTDVLTPLPQLVKFEANGQLSSEYGIAHGGQVTVDWTPADNDILYAKLYDINGNVMAWDTVKAQEEGDWVDLGLPSGLLWATRNVGANSPEDYGDYFAWGETQPKSVYDWDTYRYGDGITMTKYNGNDGLTVLQPNDDAATANWGDGWHMPSAYDFEELLLYSTIDEIVQDGVFIGLRCTGQNGNTIFFPAAGCRFGDDNSLAHAGGAFYNYWSSSLYPIGGWWGFGWKENLAFSLSASGNSHFYRRDWGRSVRAVRSAK